MLDDRGDRKSVTKNAHVARQYGGSIGKVDNGTAAVTSLWADQQIYYPLHVEPYTPAERLAGGKRGPAFRTKPQTAIELVAAALALGPPFRAIVADSFSGDNETFVEALQTATLPFALTLKPSSAILAPAEAAPTPKEAAEDIAWTSPEAPGDWQPVTRESGMGIANSGGQPSCAMGRTAPTSRCGSSSPPRIRRRCQT